LAAPDTLLQNTDKSTTGMQIFDTILRGLDRSPVLATRISDPDGIEFDHINFGKGKIRVWAEGNIAVVKVRIGALVPTFYELPEVAIAEPVTQPAQVE
jgi:hypothetical protein